MGERRKKAKESRVLPHPELNPGCATAIAVSAKPRRNRTEIAKLK